MRSFVFFALLCGCDSLPPAPAGPKPAPVVRDAGAPGDPAARAVVPLSVTGTATLAPSDAGAPAGRLLVALTDGPCFLPGTHYLALAWPSPGAPFTVTAFPPRGSRLELCAALVENAPMRRRRVRVWGRSERGPLVADGVRTRFAGVDVTLSPRPVELPLPEGLQLAP